jgi:hypothetical protein
VRDDRPEVLAELLDTCRRTLRELDAVADEPEVWALRSDIIEVAHEAEDALANGRPVAPSCQG